MNELLLGNAVDFRFLLLPPANEVWGKVIFYTCVSFCPRGGMRGCWGACVVAGWHAWLPGGMHGCQRGCAWLPGGMHGCQGHAWLPGGMSGCQGVWGCWEACMVARGHAWLPGMCVVARGMCVVAGGMCDCPGACMVAMGGVHGCGGCAWLQGEYIGHDEIRSMSGRYASYGMHSCFKMLQRLFKNPCMVEESA